MRNKVELQQGSVLIIFLWVLVALGLFSMSVAVRTRLGTKLEGYEQRRFQRQYDYLAGVNLARFFIEQDGDPSADDITDKWYGIPAGFLKLDLRKRFDLIISDEESKVNVNAASAELLRDLFKVLIRHGVKLKTAPEDLASSIVAWRGGGASFGKSNLGFKHKREPFESLEELYLIQYISPEDVSLIRPYLTVYGADMTHLLRININTAEPYVLEALVESLNSSVFEKKTLLERIELFRNYRNIPGRPRQSFGPQDMEFNGFMQRLGLSYLPDTVALVGTFLKNLTVDSRVFSVSIQYKVRGEENYRMQAVLGKRDAFSVSALVPKDLDILSWYEGIAG